MLIRWNSSLNASKYIEEPNCSEIPQTKKEKSLLQLGNLKEEYGPLARKLTVRNKMDELIL